MKKIRKGRLRGLQPLCLLGSAFLTSTAEKCGKVRKRIPPSKEALPCQGRGVRVCARRAFPPHLIRA